MSRRKKSASLPKKAIGYIRVSTAKQAEKGLSLDAQRAKIEAYAALYEIDMAEVIVDAGVSAGTLDRPGLKRVIAMMDQNEINAVIVVKLDRLTRSVRDLGGLIEDYFSDGQIGLLSVSEQLDTRSAAGRLVLHILGAVSRWELDSIGERTSATMQHHSATGGYVGGLAPFGFEANPAGELVAHMGEQATIEAARELRPGLSLRALSTELASRGHTDRLGKAFHPMAISRMLGETERTFRPKPTSGE